MNILYNNIKKILKEKKRTFQWLAKEIGYSRQGLSNGLNNKTIKYETIEKISNVLDVSLNQIFTSTILENEDGAFIAQFINTYDFNIAEFYCQRYETFSEQISCLKDGYIRYILRGIKESGKPFFGDGYINFFGFIINDEELEILKELSFTTENIPFSKWDKKEKELLTKTKLLLPFYTELFKANYLHINSYIQDGLIKDKEILKYRKIFVDGLKS